MSGTNAEKAINRSSSFSLQEKQTLREVVGQIAITEGAAITDASTAHALNATFSDTEVEAALNALGTKINAILAALEAADVIA